MGEGGGWVESMRCGRAGGLSSGASFTWRFLGERRGLWVAHMRGERPILLVANLKARKQASEGRSTQIVTTRGVRSIGPREGGGDGGR